MKTLWAPWRMSYILGKEDQKKGCIVDCKDNVSFTAAARFSKKSVTIQQHSS